MFDINFGFGSKDTTDTDEDDDPAFEPVDGTCIAARTREHRNDEETHVVVVGLGGDRFLAVAVDVDEDCEPVASHLITSAFTSDEAVERADAWVEKNPKGIKGEASGLLGSLGG